MGRLFAFECAKCGYRASVSGGEDRGTHCFTRTIVCEPCRRLYEVVTHVRWPRMAGDAPGGPASRAAQRALRTLLPSHVDAALVVSRRPGLMVGRLLSGCDGSGWVEAKVQCPASARHRTSAWRHPGRCPRCQAFLETTLMPVLVWD